MGSHTIKKLYLRLFFLALFSTILIYDYLSNTDIMNQIINIKLFNIISITHVFWFYLMFEMFIILIPKFNKYSYSGKHLVKHYLPEKKYDSKELIEYSKQNNKKALRSAIFWIALNTPIAILFFFGFLDNIIMYWIFFLYYFFDTICINVFCIFHLFITKNKCCNECRIYNWAHFMYCTPLIFVPNFWTYSLVFVSILILIQWEIAVYKHPERFSPISNKILQCSFCPHNCRYNENKTDIYKRVIKFNNNFKNIIRKVK